MSRNPITQQPVVLALPNMDEVTVERDLRYRNAVSVESRPCTFDVYRPSRASTGPLPAVLFVSGYSDLGAEKMLGCKLKEMASYECWARLVACSGLVAITYDNEEPVSDLRMLLEHVKGNAGSLGVDASRLGIWSCSGNVPNALALLGQADAFRCAALCYGYMLDDGESTEVADAAKQFYFANPTAGVLPVAFTEVPILLVRAGRDETPGLNASLDRFVSRALEDNLPLSVVNHRDGPHAFDVLDSSDRSKAIIRQVLCFLETNLNSLNT